MNDMYDQKAARLALAERLLCHLGDFEEDVFSARTAERAGAGAFAVVDDLDELENRVDDLYKAVHCFLREAKNKLYSVSAYAEEVCDGNV